MEAFTLLKYWRSTTTTTTTAAASSPSSSSSDGEDGDGPFFDLEFSLNDQEDQQENAPTTEMNEEDDTESESDAEEEEEVNVALSPSDEGLFFKGDLVSIHPSSTLLLNSEEEDHNSNKIPVFLVKSATKFRVLLLKLKKPKPGNSDASDKTDKDGKVGTSKLLSLKFKVDEALPLVSLFTRDASSKETNNNGGNNKGLTKRSNAEEEEDEVEEENGASEERRVAKEVVQKYLKMVKPFYIRVSKRYVEKLKFSGKLEEKGGEVKSEAAKQGSRNLQAVVRKRLGKSRSAPAEKTAAERRDDSLLQVQDGIQGAILHCKRSFNASRDVESSSILCRSVSDPSHEKSVIMPKGSKGSTTSFSSVAAKESKA